MSIVNFADSPNVYGLSAEIFTANISNHFYNKGYSHTAKNRVMNIVIVGNGKFGNTMTEYISKENYNVVVIDINPDIVEKVINQYDVLGIVGNGTNYETQMEAGVNHADILIAATHSDELNILCCIVAKKIGAKNTIARVRNPEYANQKAFWRDSLGINQIVNPDYEIAEEISRILRFPSAVKIESFSKGRVELAEIKLGAGNPLIGLALHSLNRKFNIKVLVCAVQRGEQVYIPSGNFTLESGDSIYVTASHNELSSFVKALGIYKQRVKSAIIIGGGKNGYYLAKMLCDSGLEVKLIEKNEKRCEELTEMLPNARIVHGEGTEQALLMEERIDSFDACVALTDIDEENIIISMFAEKMQINKIVTKIDRMSFLDMLGSIGIESILSPQDVSANLIIQYIRATENSNMSNSVQRLYKLLNNRVEALEFYVAKDESSEFIGIQLRDLKLKNEVLIACIIRGTDLIYPKGDDTINAGDIVIVVTTNTSLKALEDIFR